MTAPIIPPVSDQLPISLRAFAGPQFVTLPDPDAPKPKAKTPPLPASDWTLIFDTETTTHPGQALRFGTYQFRKGDELDEAGIFYDPEGVTTDELLVIRDHAHSNSLELRTREEFVDQVFFARAFQLRATIVGFNLPFDISRVAINHGTAKVPLEADTHTMRGAFTFKLSNQKIYPNVRIKHMSQRAALISFSAPMRQRDGRGHRNRGFTIGVRRGHFVDVKTIAGALFARNFSLGALSKFLKVEHPKLDFDEFDGPVTDDMVRYAVRDVQTTWECYRDVQARIAKLGLSRTILEKIYSEASIGKGYMREIGIVPFRDKQSHLPRDLLAKIMGSYFGGRSEIRIRSEMRQVILCDFLSMYPTVCTLMGLWRFIIADGMTWIETTDATRTRLDKVDLEALQSKDAWASLHTLVRVKPQGEIFPVRAAYAEEAQTTIGANHLTWENPLWFTLADCIAAKLLTGKTPEIVEAITFQPGLVQQGLRPIDIGGNPDYRVDPVETDFFKRVIELRQSIKARRDLATGAEREALETEQNALKIAANATSYGIYIEVNVETRPKPKATTVHSSTCEPFSLETDKAEMLGTYFHPLLGTLITGAARLMLAIAETLIVQAGLEWSFCDTDSMAIAKPIDMDADEFAARVEKIVEWFSALNPYAFGGSILQMEKVNASLETGEPQPLYCWAISSKRYALFNLSADGKPIMRKVSAHGLGHLLSPYGDDGAPENFPTPDKSVLGHGIQRWHCDLWYQIVSAALAGHPDRVSRGYHPALSQPAISRYSATSPELLAWFKTYNRGRPDRDQVKPFGFLYSMSQALAFDEESPIAEGRKRRRKAKKALKPTAPFDRDYAKAIASAFDRETGQPVSVASLKSYDEALARYHIQPESKFLNADYNDSGTTIRRHIEMTGTLHIGKESHDWERQAMIGLNRDSEIEYGIGKGGHVQLVKKLDLLVADVGRAKAANSLGVSQSELNAVLKAKGGNRSNTVRRIAAHLPAAIDLNATRIEDRENELRALRQAVESDGLRATARRLGIDHSNLRRRLKAFNDDVQKPSDEYIRSRA